jgi:mannose-6-phosphate isomerase-like protein (cupin superfamily)
MQIMQLGALRETMTGSNSAWLEFLRFPSLSTGIYQLAVGQEDRQQPHTEDEVYYVISGRASFLANNEIRPVQTGTIIFVEKLVPHRFINITQDLTVLVFFAPAEHSLKPALDGPH